MKKVKNLSQINDIIDNKWDLYKIKDMQRTPICVVALLKMTLLDVIALIEEGVLFYSSDF